ncbi:PKD domain-containing protein [Nocardioides sp. J2M5]|uniref:PKD domain-containing protein n=1 Tax=Nocardioides palaemonis TaxID=2829810 RepID=UPI001BACA6C3|nr:PKD domain-containing protein [Nocardioides palaemonis]MBS2936906.1 PKD domain-containing protein [Nocardioides palaemonis]
MPHVLRTATPVTVTLAVAGGLLSAVPAVAAPVVEPPGWTPTTTLSATTDVARGAGVAADASGATTAVWVARDATSGSIFANRVVTRTHDASGWSTPVDLAAGLADVSRPVVVAGPGGRATAVWALGYKTNSLVVASSRSAAGTWSAPVALSQNLTASATAIDVDLDASADGTVTAAWVEDGVVVTSTRPVDGTWSATVAVSPADQYAYRTDLDVTADGSAAVTWRSNDRGAPPMPAPEDHVGAATRVPGSAWAEPVEVAATDDVGDPVVAVAPDGTTTLAWPDTTVEGGSLVSARRPVGGSWSAPETVATGAVGQAALVALPDGRVTAAWTQDVAAGSYVAYADRAGSTWSSATSFYPVSGAASDVSLVVDASGSTAATWVNRDPAGRPFVQVARRPAGQGWVAVDDLTGPITDRQLPSPEPQVAWDGDGNLTSVWSRINGVDNVVQTRTFDAVAPTIVSVDAPARARTKDRVTYSVTASDAWGPVSATWRFSELSPDAGTSVHHTYTRPGTYNVRLVVTDAAGNETVRFVTTKVSWARPGLKVRTNRRAIHRAGSSRSPRKVRARIALTQGAKVTVEVKRAGRSRTVARVTKRLAAGHRTLRLSSRIGGRNLAVGRYTLVVRAKNGHGASRTVKVPLRVKR